jgi:hypothetical protein
MLGLVTLVVALVGTVYFVKFTDENWKWKLLMIVLTLGSLLFQWVIPLHFLIPLITQTVVGIWVLIYWKYTG